MSTLLDIKNLIDANYPDNTTGLITPAKERQVLKALADFVVSSQGEVETAPFVWDPAFSYGDGDPVIYDQAWYLSLSAANLANQPDTSPLLWEPVNAFNTVLSLWEVNGVYIGELNIVLKDGKLYQLNRTLVGDVPFVSTDFAAELAAGEWINLLPDTKPVANTYADTTSMIAAQGAQVEGYLYKAGTALYLYLGTTAGNISDYYQVTGSAVTPTPPVAAVYANNAAMFAAQGAQITDYIYQSGTSFFRYKGTTAGDITDYVQIGGGGAVTPPVAATYASLAAMIAAQGSQISGYIYADDKAYYQYLGTTAGNITDYRRLAPADIPSVDESYANTAAMIVDQANQLSGWLYFDGADYWEYLGTTAGTIADYRLIGLDEAPTDGSHYARKNSGWVSFTPFTVAETPSEGQVVTWVSGVPTWQTPSGGGGGNFIAFDVSQSLTGPQKIQALSNLGLRGSAVQTVTTIGTINNFSKSSNNLLFSGSGAVTITGIASVHDGEEIIILNRTNNVLTLASSSASSSAENRFFGGMLVPNNTSVLLRYSSSLQRWVVVGSPFHGNTEPTSLICFRTDNPLAINREGFDNVALTLQAIAGTSYSILAYNNSSQITFEVQNSTAAFPNVNLGVRRGAISNVALVAQSPASNQFALGLYTNTGANGAFVNNSMEWTSIGGAGFGVTAGGSPTARVDIRGRGTTTGQTLLLEASDGTDNARFIDNGNIDFLRLPTSDPLVAGRLWLDTANGRVIKISNG